MTKAVAVVLAVCRRTNMMEGTVKGGGWGGDWLEGLVQPNRGKVGSNITGLLRQ